MAQGTGRKRGGFKASRHGTGSTKARASASGPKAAQKHAAEAREASGKQVATAAASRFLRGKKIAPRRIDGRESVVQLIDGTFQAYNSGRLREAAQLFTEKMLGRKVTVGLTLTGALTPAGLGMSCLIPLIEAGFVDWIISTGANLYHDTHFGLGLAMHRGNPTESDVLLREDGVVHRAHGQHQTGHEAAHHAQFLGAQSRGRPTDAGGRPVETHCRMAHVKPPSVQTMTPV